MLNALPNQVIFCRRYLLLNFKPVLFPERLLCQTAAGETEGLRLIKTMMRHANLGWKSQRTQRSSCRVQCYKYLLFFSRCSRRPKCISHSNTVIQNALRNQLTSSPEGRKLVPARINDQNQFQYMTTQCWSVNRYVNLFLVMVVSLFPF